MNEFLPHDDCATLTASEDHWTINIYSSVVKTSVSETIRKPPVVKAQTTLRKQKNEKYSEKRFSIWRMKFLRPAMLSVISYKIYSASLNAIGGATRQASASCPCGGGSSMSWDLTWRTKLYCIDFARWLHTAMWHVALGSWQWIHQVAVGLPCNVTRGSGMTCHWIRRNVRHIGILLLVSILTISPQSTCHFAPICEIFSKSDNPRLKFWCRLRGAQPLATVLLTRGAWDHEGQGVQAGNRGPGLPQGIFYPLGPPARMYTPSFEHIPHS